MIGRDSQPVRPDRPPAPCRNRSGWTTRSRCSRRSRRRRVRRRGFRRPRPGAVIERDLAHVLAAHRERAAHEPDFLALGRARLVRGDDPHRRQKADEEEGHQNRSSAAARVERGGCMPFARRSCRTFGVSPPKLADPAEESVSGRGISPALVNRACEIDRYSAAGPPLVATPACSTIPRCPSGRRRCPSACRRSGCRRRATGRPRREARPWQEKPCGSS